MTTLVPAGTALAFAAGLALREAVALLEAVAVEPDVLNSFAPHPLTGKMA